MTLKILVTGGDGRFAKLLKDKNNRLNLVFKSKKDLNILKINTIENCIKKEKPKIILHTAGLSRPMSIHEKDINKSVDLNIIGTCNIVKICKKYNIKLIYFSTGYVYEGIKGNHKENAPVKPFNNYGLSKLGGECAVQMYKNSLILRIIMCERPFVHKTAFYDIKTNFIFQDDVIKMIPKILSKKGIINIGGKTQSIYNFAKKYNKKIKRASGRKIYPPNPSMNLTKLKKILG